jgi:hypothetical protein
MLRTSGNVVNPVRRIGMSILTQKKCSKCGEVKSADNFNKDASMKSGLRSYCRQCQTDYKRESYANGGKEKTLAYNKKWRAANPDKVSSNKQQYYKSNVEVIREKKWIANYGITRDEYDAMLKAQGGKCAICGAPKPGGRGDYFHVDHDHETNEVRGLLCTNCNTGIGGLKDNVGILQKAIAYLLGRR